MLLPRVPEHLSCFHFNKLNSLSPLLSRKTPGHLKDSTCNITSSQKPSLIPPLFIPCTPHHPAAGFWPHTSHTVRS